MQNCVDGGVFLSCNERTFVRVSLHLEMRSRIALEKQCLFHSSLCFRARYFTTITLHDLTDFYVESATTAPHYNTCFHSRWPN